MHAHRESNPRVVIIGGSLGGLNAALWLEQAGCQVEVFERSRTYLQDRGAGIMLHPETIRYLVERDAASLDTIGVPITRNQYLGCHGDVEFQRPMLLRSSAYGTVYAAMLHSMDPSAYHLGEQCIGLDQHECGVSVQFASGRTETGDLVVFADGINSTGRQLLFGDIEPTYAGYVAWRGAIDERDLPDACLALFDQTITYHMLPDSHVIVYPIPNLTGEVEPGERIMNWLWYRNITSDDELESLMTDRSGQHRGTSVPPGQIQEQNLQRLAADAGTLPGPITELMHRTPNPFIQVIFDIAVPRMVDGRACIIGDAAFTVRPHAAAGTAKAARDAFTLAHTLHHSGNDIRRALAEWEPDQLALGRLLLERARDVGDRQQSGSWQVGEFPPFGLAEIGDSALTGDAIDALRSASF
jgi:2,6-dihydroxypyridine 3-monooxygenase